MSISAVGAETHVDTTPSTIDFSTFSYNLINIRTAVLPDGSHFVMYEDNNLSFRRFNSDGTPATDVVVLDDFANSQEAEFVLTSDGFVVTWRDRVTDAGQSGASVARIVTQKFDFDGARIGTEHYAYTGADSALNPHITDLGNGQALVSWFATAGSPPARGHLIDLATGAPTGAEFGLGSGLWFDGGQTALLAGGNLAIVWDQTTLIKAQVIAPDGTAVSAVVDAADLVPFPQNNDRNDPTLVALDDGGFVVSWWGQFNQDGSSWGVFGQKFDASGARVGDQFILNTTTDNQQFEIDLQALPGGGFIGIWNSTGQDQSGEAIVAQLFNEDGSKNGAEFVVNTSGGAAQWNADAGVNDAGDLVIAWQSHHLGANEWQVMFQKYALTVPGAPSAGDDVLTGTEGDDAIAALGGNDVIDGLAGNDFLDGGSGDDTINGGDGDDTITDGTGYDEINGGAGTDTFVRAYDGSFVFVPVIDLVNEVLYAQADPNDSEIITGIENLTMTGLHHHHMIGGTEANRFQSGGGDDTQDGGGGNDTLIGGAGADSQLGGAGEDQIAGGADGDVLFGNQDADTLLGQNGDDRLDGGVGNDSVSGGSGLDTIIGGGGFDTLRGGGGDDTVNGGDGRDLVFMGGGNDLFIDNAQGGANGRDTVYANAGNDTVGGGNGDDVFNGQDGNDRLLGRLGNDKLFGGNQNDTMVGGDGNDTIAGGNGRDRAFMGNGNDTWFDNAQVTFGDDSVVGGNGDDTIRSDAGNDTLSGGAGADLFIFAATLGDVTVTDFDTAADAIDMSAALWTGAFDQAYLDSISDTSSGSLVLALDNGGSLTFSNLTDNAGLLDTIHFIA